MKLADGGHLTYCSNIHPGETWDEVWNNLRRYLPAVKQRVAPAAELGVGLRLSAAAAVELARPERLRSFRAWLQEQGLYVFTLNGFPYGDFHATRVKETVYLPDWRDPARLEYSRILAEVLAVLLPEGVPGSISSVPLAYRHPLPGETDRARMREHLVRHAIHLERIWLDTGRSLALALEPEPGCLLETTGETVEFFQREMFGNQAIALAMRLAGMGGDSAEAMLRRRIGLCLDACHAAVAFEDPAATLSALRGAGIAIAKLQLSAGLRVIRPGSPERAALKPFAEDVYLHQTRARDAEGTRMYLHQTRTRDAEGIRKYADLPEALADPAAADEWRIHYHVPLWAERMDAFTTTAPWLEELLRLHRQSPISSHLEVETYTWSVLPEPYRKRELADAIAGEMDWVLRRLA